MKILTANRLVDGEAVQQREPYLEFLRVRLQLLLAVTGNGDHVHLYVSQSPPKVLEAVEIPGAQRTMAATIDNDEHPIRISGWRT